MKKIIILGFLAGITCIQAVEIDDMIIEIKKERDGVKSIELKDTPEPFAIIKKEKEKQVIVVPEQIEVVQKSITLNGIMNKTAFINGTWYSIDDVIEGYTLKYIGKKGVVLRRGDDIKKVFLEKAYKNKINIMMRER